MRLTAEREQLRGVVRDVFEKETARGGDVTGRAQAALAGIGVTGVLVPERLGGAGGAVVDAVVVGIEVGRALVGGPRASSVAAQRLVADDDLLGGIVAGRWVTLLGLDGEVQLHAGRVRGEIPLVEDAHLAEHVVVIAGGIVWATAPGAAGVTIQRLGSMGPHEACTVTLDVAVDDCRVLGATDDIRVAEARAVMAVIGAAEAAGGAERVYESALQYAKDREQFGRPIGDFQAVQFRCVDMLLDVEAMRCITFRAAAALDAGDPERLRLASAAAAWCGDAYVRVTGNAHRIFGAIGFSAELELQRYTKAAEAARPIGGGPRRHRRDVLDAVASVSTTGELS